VRSNFENLPFSNFWIFWSTQIGTLSRKLQTEPPPKVVKVTMSQKVPLTGEELKAFEEQSRAKQDILKTANISHEEGVTPATGTSPGPVVATTIDPVKSTEGIMLHTS
jgi:cleavage and polyadenylation specificity factor subunit 2